VAGILHVLPFRGAFEVMKQVRAHIGARSDHWRLGKSAIRPKNLALSQVLL